MKKKKRVIEKVSIIPHHEYEEQLATINNERWSVIRLVALSENFEVMEVPIKHMDISHTYDGVNLRELAGYIKAVNDADLNRPIILDENGSLMDGRHRIVKSLVQGKKTIKAVRFNTNPTPCSYVD